MQQTTLIFVVSKRVSFRTMFSGKSGLRVVWCVGGALLSFPFLQFVVHAYPLYTTLQLRVVWQTGQNCLIFHAHTLQNALQAYFPWPRIAGTFCPHYHFWCKGLIQMGTNKIFWFNCRFNWDRLPLSTPERTNPE